MNLRIGRSAAAALLLVLAAAAASSAPSPEPRKPLAPAATNIARRAIADWPDGSRLLAGAIIEECGAPDEVEPAQLTWLRAPPWKKIIVFRDALTRGHPGGLRRTLAYRVPLRAWRALGAFGHGVEYDAVNGLLSARTDSEETNYLALNLADEVVRERLSASEASAFYDLTLNLLISGKTSSYATRLRFKPD